MSAEAHAPGHAANGHGPNGHHGDAHAHGTLRGYLTGFGLSVVLTAVPFWLVMSGVLGSAPWTTVAVMALAVVQIFVHMIYFLHMTPRSEGGWSMMALIFTLIMVVIVLSGSLWVMYHLNTNMMPGHEMGTTP